QSGLKIKIFINQRISAGDPRNPLSFEQRRDIILQAVPELSAADIFPHPAMLSENIDSYTDCILPCIREKFDLEKAVLFCMLEHVDMKIYTYRGRLYPNTHYSAFLCKPIGPLDMQEITRDMVSHVFHATQMRAGVEHT